MSWNGNSGAQGANTSGGRGGRGGNRGSRYSGRGGRPRKRIRKEGISQDRRGYRKPKTPGGVFFKDKTKDMNRHVFQTHSEKGKREQFQDMLDTLKVYLSTIYKKDIK